MATPFIEVDVRSDTRQASVFLRAVHRKGIRKATPRALNKTARAVVKVTAKDIQAHRNINIRAIKKAMRIRKANERHHAAYIVVSGRPIPMRHFAIGGKRGVTARIEKNTKRYRLVKKGKKAFINKNWPKAGGNVFVRLGYPSQKNPKREAIGKWPPVVGLPRVLVQDAIVNGIRRTVAKVFPRRFREEVAFEIKRERDRARARFRLP